MQSFNSSVPSRQIQQKLIQALYEVNKKEFSFEEAANPTIPGCRVIFEFGLADAESFNFIDGEEVEKALSLLANEPRDVLDFFCAVRYYRGEGENKRPLKFDYYLVRTVYNRNIFEIQIYHKRGLRYVSPEDLTLFIVKEVNQASKGKASKKQLLSPK